MGKIALAMISVVCVLALLPTMVFAQDYEVFSFGLSDDGSVWTVQTVQVPVDGYITVDFNGCEVWFWGSEFDESYLPATSSSPDCKCSVHLKSLCTCEKQCWVTINGNYRQGTCVP